MLRKLILIALTPLMLAQYHRDPQSSDQGKTRSTTTSGARGCDQWLPKVSVEEEKLPTIVLTAERSGFPLKLSIASVESFGDSLWSYKGQTELKQVIVPDIKGNAPEELALVVSVPCHGTDIAGGQFLRVLFKLESASEIVEGVSR
jgi:hypothetical protein